MWFSRNQASQPLPGGADSATQALPKQITTKSRGDDAEAAALEHLLRSGLNLVETNYRTPGRGGGEIDLIMRCTDGTLVFVEVRQRSSTSYGGAAASIGAVKQRRIIFAARHYLMRFASLPPCRFDVVLVQGTPGKEGTESPVVQIEWMQAAFDAS